MEMLHVVLWLIYPYTVVAILGMGLVWQYDVSMILADSEIELKSSLLLRKLVTSLMGLSFLTGVAVVLFYSMTNEPKQLFNWVISLFRLQPDMNLIMNISILSQIHLFLVLTLLLVLSFTKYISYLFNPHQLFKVRFVKKINKL